MKVTTHEGSVRVKAAFAGGKPQEVQCGFYALPSGYKHLVDGNDEASRALQARTTVTGDAELRGLQLEEKHDGQLIATVRSSFTGVHKMDCCVAHSGGQMLLLCAIFHVDPGAAG